MRNNKLVKLLWIITGFATFGLGTLGVFLPFLPTFPFYLCTLVAFAKSSTRLHNWFVSTDLYKKNLESYVKRKEMTKSAKRRLMVSLTLVMGTGFAIMAVKGIEMGCIAITIVWIVHIVYFMFKVKNVKEEKAEV